MRGNKLSGPARKAGLFYFPPGKKMQIFFCKNSFFVNQKLTFPPGAQVKKML